MSAPTHRPLSPHLQVYRLPLTGLVSISHRITGVVLAIGVVFFVALLLAVAGGEHAFEPWQHFLNGWTGRSLLFAWSYALFFHLCHGIRHLIWDTGHGFGRDQMTRLALLEVVASILVTLVVWGGVRLFGE